MIAPVVPSCQVFDFSWVRNVFASPQVTRIKEVIRNVFSKISSSLQAFYRPTGERNIKNVGMTYSIYVIILALCLPLIYRRWRVQDRNLNQEATPDAQPQLPNELPKSPR